jgi:hypothetical protein
MVKIPIPDTMAVLAAAIGVGVAMVWLPAYRLFFVISWGIGVMVAGILTLRHKLFLVREDDIENKRPLGLQGILGLRRDILRLQCAGPRILSSGPIQCESRAHESRAHLPSSPPALQTCT